ncbi:MAG: hypothetical protein ACRYGK_06850 [Janthinobacterium lividum]
MRLDFMGALESNDAHDPGLQFVPASCRSVPIILYGRAIVVGVGAEILKADSCGWTSWVRLSQTIRTTPIYSLDLLRAVRIGLCCMDGLSWWAWALKFQKQIHAAGLHGCA